MSDNTDVCDPGHGAVGVEPDHLTAGGVDVVMLSISADTAEVGADRSSHFQDMEILKFKRSTNQLWLSFHRFCFLKLKEGSRREPLGQ